MSKVMSVKTIKEEVASNLELRGVPSFEDLGLRPINTSVKNLTNSIKNTVFKKAGKQILGGMPDNREEKIEKIKEIVNGDISLDIRLIDYDEELPLIRNRDDYLEVIMTDNRNDIQLSFLSYLEHEPTSKKGLGIVRKLTSNQFYQVIPLSIIIGITFVFNMVIQHGRKHKEVMGYIIKENDYPIYFNNNNDYVRFMSHFQYFIDNKTIDERFMQRNNELLLLSDLFMRSSNKDIYGDYFYCVFDYYIRSSIFIGQYNYLIGLNREIKNDVKNERRKVSDYAKSYETKKNIPDYIKEAMSESFFLSHFGFVEYDELTDLEKMNQIENEWVSLAYALNLPIKNDHSLRFRRLGHHNAGGLYFNSEKTICVDLDHPGSLIHEIGHMIDYTHLEGEVISSTHDFDYLHFAYVSLIERNISQLEDDDSLKIQWNSTSKYNKNYYTSRKESFARIYEIFVKYVLKIDNSLVEANGPLYPNDERLLGVIRFFFKKVNLM